MKLAVLGAGAWGTALAVNFACHHRVSLWSRHREAAQTISATRENTRYLPGFTIPDSVHVCSDLPVAIDRADAVVCAVPMVGLRDLLGSLRAVAAPIVLACKGFETRTGRLPHEVVHDVLGSDAAAVLSGPSFAREVARGLPTAVVLASADAQHARRLALALHSPRLRIYSSDDLVGVAVAGAAKNVMAIAAGISDGMALGSNARAALISRGLAEMSRLGLKLGGRIETFMGLAGAGDLVLTCTGDLSRNRTVGLRLAAGMPLAEVLASLGHVAEGVSTAREVARRALALGIEMPITRAVCAVLEGSSTAAEAVAALLERDPKSEF